MNEELLLPAGARVLHIGPFKTGSTTLQAAFHQNRDALRRQGVEYPAEGSNPMVAAMAVAGGRRLPGRSSLGLEHWQHVVEEVGAAGAHRTVVSSEFFCEAPEDSIATILEELGGDRVHVVVTLRPLARILPSQWQQYAQNQKVASYPEWLDAMLNHPDDTSLTPSFWRRHRHDQVVRRWADVAGADHVTVIAVDQADRRMLLRTFEQLVGLEPETLVPPDVEANRSLTFPEVEMLREFNRRFGAHTWSSADYTRLVRFGAARHLQRRSPGPDEPRLLTPAWAVDAANEVAAEMVRGIRASGVRVVGDLDALVDAGPASAVGENLPRPDVPVEAAVRFSAGLVERLVSFPAWQAPQDRPAGPFEATMRSGGESRALERQILDEEAHNRSLVPLQALGSRVLLRELVGRLRRRLRRGTKEHHD
ncbi:MAG: hypothetical protein ACR2FG_01300 [Marmoricola sp.]